jgi:hypothetical protein
MARLRLLSTYYLSGRKVDSFEGMVNLFLCDRLKATLSEPMLAHVLRTESTLGESGYLAPKELVSLLDSFASTFNKFGQPKHASYTAPRKAGDQIYRDTPSGVTIYTVNC